MFITLGMRRAGFLALVCLLSGCTASSSSTASSISTVPKAEAPQPNPVIEVVSKPTPLPGQRGPTPALLQGPSVTLTTRRTQQRFPDGNSVWKVELRRGDALLASWDAASGIGSRQQADRRWSPGNAAPLPAGVYSLGRPEPWGNDLWFDLTPRFDTTRSALGIHRCYPGTGCICIPDRADIDALAHWVKASEIRTLKVLN